MTSDDQHLELASAWVRLAEKLQSRRNLMDFGDETFHVEFATKADRVASLGRYLKAAVKLSDEQLYGPAFAVLRGGLEHAVFDWLLFLGETYVERRQGVDDETWRDWEQDRAAGASWTANVKSWSRTKRGDVTIRWQGLLSEPDQQGAQENLSIYYFLLDEYDGSLGKPSDQEADDVLSVNELRQRAQENEARWLVYLRWAALSDNLIQNKLIDAADAGRLDAHYRFLSSFAHPFTNNGPQVYGRSNAGEYPRFDHFTSELVLLYAVSIASLELRTYHLGVSKRLASKVIDADDVEDDLEVASAAASHFWFLGDQPHPRDIHDEANRLAMRQIRSARGPASTAQDSGVPLEFRQVSFPRDPLARLIRQHVSSRGRVEELAYISPWPRSDAAGRG
ncbi:hypothetical protein [uncultured Microbacterium sp.]|uniref:hypothetical protein n=1 Tax=uncultured Microbacterium sp. TaxID=191216 RepID=UPI0025D5C4F8|nr:hypothetical protein [uncultured Microbacterium sp.]